MRITNSIMHRNSLTNMNKNKVYLDKLNTQQVTGKKINRPSDDPIVAIRALRLRSSLAQVTQFHDKNVKDADAWLDATRGAVDKTKEILESIKANFTNGANGTHTPESRKAILDALKAARDQVYANSDADYADRTIFTGYRTASKVTFQKDEMVAYKDITEGFNASDLEALKYISGKLDKKTHIVDYDKLAGTNIDIDEVENSVQDNTVTRIRLSYDDLDKAFGQAKNLIYRESFKATSVVNGNSLTVTSRKEDADGALQEEVSYELSRGKDGKYELSKVTRTEYDAAGNPTATTTTDVKTDATTGAVTVTETRTDANGTQTRETVTTENANGGVTGTVTITEAAGAVTTGTTTGKSEGKFIVEDAAGNKSEIDPLAVCTINEDGTYTIGNGSGDFATLTASGKVKNAYAEKTLDVTVTSIADGADAKDAAYKVGDDDIHFIPETGELILGTNVANTLSGLKNIDGIDTIEFAYDKSDWRKGDLRPEHYFDCKDQTDPDERKWINYTSHDQEICYDVSANQSMRVNTLASDIFLHAIGRDIDEMVGAIEDVYAAEDKVETIENKLKDTSLSDDDKAVLNKLLDAAKKELTYVSDKMQKMFEHGQTTFEGYVHTATLAGEQVGDRQARLGLVEDRLLELKTTVQELADNNENVDEISIMTDIKQAELAYEAALMATAKIAQQSLLNYL